MKTYKFKENEVIRCRTEQEDKKIRQMATDQGYRWISGDPFNEKSKWYRHKEDTCINVVSGTYSPTGIYADIGYDIVEASDIISALKKEPSSEFQRIDIEDLKIGNINSIAEDEEGQWRNKLHKDAFNRSAIYKAQQIALNIMDAMDNQGLTLEDLCDKTGMDEDWLENMLEGGTDMTIVEICKVENVLDVELIKTDL